jgi:hypothetical protein
MLYVNIENEKNAVTASIKERLKRRLSSRFEDDVKKKEEKELEQKTKIASSPAMNLYGDTLQSILMFLEPIELAACMMVSKSWMETTKRPTVWTGKILRIAEHAVPYISELYNAPWATLALRYVGAVVIFASHTSAFHATTLTDCYAQLIKALKLGALPLLRKVCMLNDNIVELAESLAGNQHVDEVDVGDVLDEHSFNNRLSFLQSMPNLQITRITSFYDFNNYYDDGYNSTKFTKFCEFISMNRSLHHLVFPLEYNMHYRLMLDIRHLYDTISKHPTLKTLEIQIYGVCHASFLDVILKHCGGICANLELLHIKQVARLGFETTYPGINSTDASIAMIKKTLLEKVLLEKFKMHVHIELVASSKMIQRYRKMLRELPAYAAELAKERVWIRLSKPSSAKKGTLLHFV